MTVWLKSRFEDELEEFNEAASDLAGGEAEEQTKLFEKMKSVYQSAKPQPLLPSVWRTMSNSDSYYARTIDYIRRAILKNTASNGKRDIYAMILEVLGSSARCPIIVSKDGKYRLVAGNTRLMACRLLDISPKVVIVRI